MYSFCGLEQSKKYISRSSFYNNTSKMFVYCLEKSALFSALVEFPHQVEDNEIESVFYYWRHISNPFANFFYLFCNPFWPWLSAPFSSQTRWCTVQRRPVVTVTLALNISQSPSLRQGSCLSFILFCNFFFFSPNAICWATEHNVPVLRTQAFGSSSFIQHLR